MTQSRVARHRTIAAGALGLVLAASGAGAANAADPAPDHDVVSNFVITAECAAGDNIHPILTYHLATSSEVPAGGHIASGTIHQIDPGDTGPGWPNSIMKDADWFDAHGLPTAGGELYFPEATPVSGDYEIDLEFSMGRSVIEGDTISAEVAAADGTVLASYSLVVDCFSDSGQSEVRDADVTVRLGVPRTVRLLQHFIVGGDPDLAAGDVVRQTWVASPGMMWSSGGRAEDTTSDLVLDVATANALGATLFGAELVIDARTAGTYALEWGAVTTPIDDPEWTGGYGDVWGPAGLTIHVLDAPVVPDASAVTDAARGSVAAPSAALAGDDLVVDLGDEAGGTYVDVWLHSDPVHLGLFQVPADGSLDVTVPATAAAGDHKVIVTDEIGTLLGWDDLTVSRGGGGLEAYVSQVYRDLFHRAPDPTGLATWTGRLAAGAPHGEVANAITASAEYRAGMITASYAEYLGRTPDPDGLAAWLRAMNAGMTLVTMQSGFLSSDEFYARYGSTSSGWVTGLYQTILHRSPGASEVAFWVAQGNAGASRAQISMGFLRSTEHLTTVVDGYYMSYLGRHLDPTGATFWVDAIQRGSRHEQIVAGLIASPEYWAKATT